MYYDDWVLAQLAQERRRDLMRQLEDDRLVRLANSGRPQRGHSIYHVLDLIGRRLICWSVCARDMPPATNDRC